MAVTPETLTFALANAGLNAEHGLPAGQLVHSATVSGERNANIIAGLDLAVAQPSSAISAPAIKPPGAFL